MFTPVTIYVSYITGLTPSHLRKTQSTEAHHTLCAQPYACAPAPSDMVPDVLEFYPDIQLAIRLWNVYVKSVDPVLKFCMYQPFLEPRSAQSSTVALTFAIYFAALTALCHDDDHEPIDLPCEKLVLFAPL
jgi:hypothetical protein